VIETALYAPQPDAAMQLITETYMIWGIVATLLILLLFVLTLPVVIRRTGYEFFRKAHYVLAMVYIGACYAHWEKLSAFLYPSLVLWFVDRVIRLVRSAVLHYQVLPNGSMGFRTIQANMIYFPDPDNGDVVRLDFRHSQDPWKVGQHFYLCFTECSLWQSHPFTPLSLPILQQGLVQHSYIFRAKTGETKKLADLAYKKLASDTQATTSLILSGSYGERITENLTHDTNVLCVAGGTGITYVLPVLLWIISQPASKDRRIELIWAVRRRGDVQWVQAELDAIRQAEQTHHVKVHLFVTREATATPLQEDRNEKASAEVRKGGISSSTVFPGSGSTSGAEESEDSNGDYRSHPDLLTMVPSFVDDTIRGPTKVYGSGPGGMISDLRSVIAGCNSGAQVWKGNRQFDVSLVADNRLE
jgi:ferric-chelate reductase